MQPYKPFAAVAAKRSFGVIKASTRALGINGLPQTIMIGFGRCLFAGIGSPACDHNPTNLLLFPNGMTADHPNRSVEPYRARPPHTHSLIQDDACETHLRTGYSRKRDVETIKNSSQPGMMLSKFTIKALGAS